MGTDTERAVGALEEALEGLVAFVRAAAYGLRLATKKVGDLTHGGASLPAGRGSGRDELELLVEALQQGEDRLSDVTVLAMGDHFRVFLARALELPHLPPLPATPAAVEELAGAPGALAKMPAAFGLLLQLHRAALQGGRLDRAALDAAGLRELELSYPGGKVKMFREGDHVTLTEQQLRAAADALLEAAKAIRLRLLTA
ncbi:MAG: hypothetical protein SCH98_17140 [Deferrisomatales bacterium]|nr:hypothetical protein [Deferrisomatales bacterium]